VVSGDEIKRDLPPYLCQFFKEETILIFTAIRDKVTSMDYKGIPILRYLLHDGHECPLTPMAIREDGELEGIRGDFPSPLQQGRPIEGMTAFS
jgi:hypothetical protein